MIYYNDSGECFYKPKREALMNQLWFNFA